MKCIICVIFFLERPIWWFNIIIEKKCFHFISLDDQADLVNCRGALPAAGYDVQVKVLENHPTVLKKLDTGLIFKSVVT